MDELSMTYTPNKTNILVIQAERFPDSWEYYNFGNHKLNKREILKWFKDNESEDNIWWIKDNSYEWLSLAIIDLTSELYKML